ELKHKVRFIASRQNTVDSIQGNLFDLTLPALMLSNQQIAISYEPETVEDQEIINSYGGLDNTPAYLVRLRPVLKVNGERIVVAKDGLPMGEDYNITMELISPNGVERIENTHIMGNLSAIGIVAQKAISDQLSAVSEEDDAETILRKEAINYIDRWNQAEEEFASLLHLTIIRPIPTFVTIGGVVDVTYLLDTPHGFEWKGVFIDADLKAIEAVASSEFRVASEKEKTFMQLSALQGSILENRIFEDDFQVESISTAKLFQLATRNMQPATEILTIDKTNIASILPTLSFDENIKEDITNSVNQNLTIRIPQSEITFEDWTGIGYIKEDPNTGESGYMLSGMIAGGMTAWRIDKWPEYYLERLRNPYSEPANYDPASAKYIQKITNTDLQKGKVGESLPQPLQVVVFDNKGRPVKGVDVIFTIKAGGGKFSNGLTSITVKTDFRGIASAILTLGQKTSDDPTYWWETGYAYSQQVGENIIDTSFASGMGTTTPFTAYGFPKEPSQIKKTYGDGTRRAILTFSGFISVVIEDEYGNPISNLPVDFETLDARLNTDLPNCDKPYLDTRQALITTTDDPCIKNSPTYNECPNAKSTIDIMTSSKGAAVQVILGGTPDAVYPITATCIDTKCKSLSTTFNLYSYYQDDCDETDAPLNQLVIQYIYPADPYGNNINAGKTGTTIPVMAKIFYLREGETEIDETLQCNGSTMTCTKIAGNRQYSIDTNFKSSTVTFTGQAGASQGNGIYTSTYTLSPGLNDISINATATIGTRKSNNSCSGCRTVNEDITKNVSTTMRVYGVDIQIDPVPIILIDENGYTKQDYSITYAINPSEYQALTAYAMIYKNGEKDPIVSIPTETIGKGKATISRGFQFDINSTYEMEVVLNYGTGVEIRSDRKKIPVAEINVVNDDSEVIKP
ncbi:MAG: hypothetical protein AB1478_09960, partial [Nitrospirota bacterium]